MPGIPGMVPQRPNKTGRSAVWQSMRILRRFTLPDLCRTASAKENNVGKFVRRLYAHGYVALQSENISGMAGSHKVWRLVRDIGPHHPMRCDRCGRPLGEKCENPGNGES